MLTSIVMIIFALLNGILITNEGIDAFGHLGGFLTGLFLSIIFL